MTTTEDRPAPTPAREPNPALLDAFIGTMIGDLGATLSAALVAIGDRLGLYRAMADGAPVTADSLAEATGTSTTYLRPWLANQAAGGYVTYDALSGTFSLSPEQAAVLADTDGPAFFAPSTELALGMLHDVDHIQRRFTSGEGFGWHEHDAGLFTGTERFFRPGYVANLTSSWLPALDGVADALSAGARVADVGCGHGASTVLMAQAFPRSQFVGVDYHEASIVVARRRAESAGVTANTRFVAASATQLEGSYDLVTMFDCLHDMGDPVAAARAVRQSLEPGGTFMLVEPAAGDALTDNLHPLGRVFYAASALVCTPASLSQPGAVALGPQAGPARLTQTLTDAGFSRVRIAAQSPVNLVFEAKE